MPAHHQVYVSAAGAHEVAIIDDARLSDVAVGDIRFPDGIAYASHADKVFVSDESGDADVVIDAKTGAKRSTIRSAVRPEIRTMTSCRTASSSRCNEKSDGRDRSGE